MAAIIGLDDARLPVVDAAGRAAGVFTVANRNSPGQIVVSGATAAVGAAAPVVAWA
jgi:[acyl-carrier-protein] S-malonyltransferase